MESHPPERENSRGPHDRQRSTLDILLTGFRTAFSEAFSGAQTAYKEIALVVPSNTREELYGWLGQFPKLREWLGDRVIHNLSAHSWTIVNRKFESTIAVYRESIEDDRFGVYAPMFREMGKAAAEHPDELTFALLAGGFTNLCYDGQNFFDTDHPVRTGASSYVSVSNYQAEAGTAWYLLDTSRAIKPIIYQQRIAYDLTRLDRKGSQIVQMFGPGVGVGAALRATGVGILAFVTNPLNLALLGFSALAGGASLAWNAISGGAEETAGARWNATKS